MEPPGPRKRTDEAFQSERLVGAERTRERLQPARMREHCAERDPAQQALGERAGALRLDDLAHRVDERAVLNTGGTGGLAGAAGEAQIEMAREGTL